MSARPGAATGRLKGISLSLIERGGLPPLRLPDVLETAKAADQLANLPPGGTYRPRDPNEIAAEIARLAHAGEPLTERLLRRAPWCLWAGETRLAEDTACRSAILSGVAAASRASPFKALASAFAEWFSDDLAGLQDASECLDAACRFWPGPWSTVHDRFSFFDPQLGPRRLAAEVNTHNRPVTEILRDSGIGAISAQGGYARAVTAALLEQLASSRDPDDAGRLDKVRRFALSERARPLFAGHEALIAEALLLPIVGREPSDAVRTAILNLVLDLLSDPRLRPGSWQTVSTDVQRLVRAWLNHQSLRQFLDVVDEVAVEHMWKYRRAFWEGLYEHYRRNGIDVEVWVAFGAEGARAAKRAFGTNTSFARLEQDGKQLKRAPAAQRKAFLQNPRAFIVQALPGAGEELGMLFIETKQYSDRVLELGVWERPTLDWLARKGAGWLPENFTISIGGRSVTVNEQTLDELAREHDAASRASQERLVYRSEEYPTAEVGDALGRLRRQLGEDDQPPSTDTSETTEPDRKVLLIVDNIEGHEYSLGIRPRPVAAAEMFPEDLVRTDPKPHQRDGFGWLVKAWKEGLSGALLADDMGLGKTLQVLAFLAWFRENRRKGGQRATGASGPILIVAPTALLRNWQKEVEQHLSRDTLGDCVEAFGAALSRLKARDPPSPEDALDVGKLRRADWILTTYETLASYHRAFARVAYGVVVFDEMQKIKSPDTINTHAAKVMNADFAIGVTGTPIENRLEDLWCIMDRLLPGLLGGLKDFTGRYGGEDEAALRELKHLLDRPAPPLPAPMLRRMKDEHLRGLPAREVRRYREVAMPREQAEAYERAVAEARGTRRARGEILKTIHRLRGISLHPHGGGAVDPYDNASRASWIAGSARVMQSLQILDDIRNRREKALVFLEDRAIQAVFSAVAAARFEIPEPDIINGEVAGDRRQTIVDRFQSLPHGFALLILSPKAAGIGLTITAANHVVHLSRWWNPAVEDQCNDRVYRIGQNRAVTIHIPMAVHPEFGEASFDVRLDQLLERKRALSREMLVPPVSDSDAEALYSSAVGSTEN